MNICVVGTGYVGLVTGACLADFGMNVLCIDKDETKIEALRRGEIPIHEPGLPSLVRKNVDQGRLHFDTEIGPAVQQAIAVFIAVGTPSRPDGSADLSYVRDVAESIGANLNGYKVIVTKSTVPIGTGQMIEETVRSRSEGGQQFAVVSNPEFLREGSAIEDFMYPDRVVIGSRDDRAIDIMLDVYSPLRVADVPFVITSVESSELIKYASNGFLAAKVSFINEIADLCEALGADVEVVARGMGLDKRIGSKFLHPGPGFGGSCFPKDSRAVVQIAKDHDRRFRIMEAVLEVNELTKARMAERVARALGALEGKTVAVLGLSFKPGTDDIRESPAIDIIRHLIAAGAKIRAYDPEAMGAAQRELPEIEFCADSYDAATDADGIVIATEWNEFRKLELSRLRGLLRRSLIIDLRNIYELASMENAGFEYISVGRDTVMPRVEVETT